MPLQFVAGRAVLGRLRDADTGADLPHLIHVDRRGERGRKLIGELRCNLCVIAGEDNGKPVIVETSELRAGRQRGFESFGDVAKHGVAARPSQRVVDVVEAVDVEQGEGNKAQAARCDRFVQPFEHDPPVRQPGQDVLRRQLAYRRDAACERSAELSRGANREIGAQHKHDPDRAEEAPQPIHRANKCAVGRPAQPADDTSLRVMQRLHFATAIGCKVAVESQIMQAGTPFDEVELAGIDVIGAGEYGMHLAKRRLQRGMLLGRKTAVLVLRFRKSDRGAGEHGERQDQCRDRADARGRPAGHRRACRPTRSPPGPVFSGCHSGLHSLRPSPKHKAGR